MLSEAKQIDFNHSELPNPRIVATEILEAADEPKRSGHRRSQCHRPQIIFALRATKSLLEIDVSDFVKGQLPLLDQFRPKVLSHLQIALCPKLGKPSSSGNSSSILPLLAQRFFQACVPGESSVLKPTQIKLRRRKKCPRLPGMFPI